MKLMSSIHRDARLVSVWGALDESELFTDDSSHTTLVSHRKEQQ